MLEVLREIVLVTRLERNAGIRQVFWVKAVVTRDAECAVLALARVFRARSLVTQLQSQPRQSITLRFCGSEFVKSLPEGLAVVGSSF